MIRILIVLMAVAAIAPQTDRLPVGYDRPDWLEERMSAVEQLTDSLKYDEAETSARELLVDAEERAGPDSVEAAEAIDVLSRVLFKASRYSAPEVEQLARRAVDTKRRHLEPGDPGIAHSVSGLSDIVYGLGRVSEAKELKEQSLAMLEAALGPDDPRLTHYLVALSRMEGKLGNRTAALERVEAAREFLERAPGAHPERMIRVLTALAPAQAGSGDVESAIATARQGLELAEELAQPPVLDVLNLYEILGANLHQSGKTEEARAILEQEVRLAEEYLGRDDARVAKALGWYGLVLADLGEFDEAERRLLRALEINERAFGSESGQVGDILGVLARVYSGRGDLPGLRQTLQRVLAIAEHNDPAGTGEMLQIARVNYAGVLYAEGDLPSALRIYLDTLSSIEGTDRELSETGTLTHANTAMVLENMGRLAEARHHVERAIEIGRGVFGADSPLLVPAMRRLGKITYELGDFPRGEQLLLQTLELEVRLWGSDSLQLMSTLGTLAALHQLGGDYEVADRWYQRAIEVARGGLDADDPNLADLLMIVAGNLLNLERGEQAQRLIDEVQSGESQMLPGREPQWLVTRALLHRQRGELEAARSLFESALASELRVFGQLTPVGGNSLVMLAELDWRLGDAAGAIERALEAQTAASLLLELAGDLTEREALQAEALDSKALDIATSAFATQAGDAAQGTLAREILGPTVAARGRLLDQIATRHGELVSDPSPDVRQMMLELEVSRSRVTRLMTTASMEATGDGEALKVALEDRRAAERALVEASAEYRRRQARREVGLQDVEQELAQDEAIVSYVRYQQFAGRQKQALTWDDDPPWRYAAWVIHHHGTHAFVPLASAEEIDALVEQWRSQVARPPLALGAAEARPNAYHRAATSLRRAVWDPVVTHLGQARQVFVVPEGALHLVNLATLPNDDGSYLVEDGRVLHYLSAERDLVPVGSPIDEKRRGLLAIGAPDFEHHSLPFAEIDSAPTDDDPGPDATHAATETVALYRSPPALCPDLKQASFSPLPGARVETKEIVGLWQQHDTATPSPAVELTGVRASEEAFKRMAPDYGVLHVATHGFFVQASCRTKEQLVRGTRARTTAAGEVVDSSMLLSGVVLAGANQRSTPEGVAAPEDGMLTAEEIAHLDLRGVEWVVLSACDTGLGDVIEGEGVFGLRRAFAVAGAGAVIMSLWRVPDGSPREWMRALYEHRLAGASTADSVRAASLEVIAARRKDGRSTHPYYWGAFVASGD